MSNFDIAGFAFMVCLGIGIFSILEETKPVDDDECDCDEDDCDCYEDYEPRKRQIQPVKPPRKKGKRKRRRLSYDYRD